MRLVEDLGERLDGGVWSVHRLVDVLRDSDHDQADDRQQELLSSGYLEDADALLPHEDQTVLVEQRSELAHAAK